MGFMDKIKGWLNIGGPKVSIIEIDQPISGKAGVVKGRFSITTKRAAKLAKCTQKFYVVETKGKGDEKTEETTTIAEVTIDLNADLAAEATAEHSIAISYDTSGFMDKMAGKGGMMGALGKVGNFVANAQKGILDYYVEVTCDVVGTPLDPSDKMMVRASLN